MPLSTYMLPVCCSIFCIVTIGIEKNTNVIETTSNMIVKRRLDDEFEFELPPPPTPPPFVLLLARLLATAIVLATAGTVG